MADIETTQNSEIAALKPDEQKKLTDLKEAIDALADKEGAPQSVKNARTELAAAILKGEKRDVMRALNRAKLQVELNELRDKINAAGLVVGDLADAATIRGEQLTGTITGGAGSAVAFATDQATRGASYVYNQAPPWAKIPLIGAALSGTVMVASYPLQWITRIWKTKEEAQEFGSKIRRRVGGGILAVSAVAGIGKAIIDGSNDSRSLLPEGMRTDRPNPELEKCIEDRLTSGIVVVGDNVSTVSIPSFQPLLFPIKTMEAEQVDDTLVAIPGVNKTNVGLATPTPMTLDTRTKKIKISYVFKESPAVTHSVTVNRPALATGPTS